MTTTSAPSTSTGDALRALAGATGVPTRGGFTLPSDVLDVWFAAIGAAGYPTLENIERLHDAFDVVSIRAQVSVDSLARWAEAHSDALRAAAGR